MFRNYLRYHNTFQSPICRSCHIASLNPGKWAGTKRRGRKRVLQYSIPPQYRTPQSVSTQTRFAKINLSFAQSRAKNWWLNPGFVASHYSTAGNCHCESMYLVQVNLPILWGSRTNFNGNTKSAHTNNFIDDMVVP